MRLELDADEVRLGRADHMDLVLPDPAASREHACIRRKRLGWVLEDIGSRHGTLLNGERLEGTQPLFKNDEIRLGDSVFLFDSDFDVQNADFSEHSVYLARPQDETMEVHAVATLDRRVDGAEAVGDAGLDMVARLGELFDSTSTSLPDALRHAVERIHELFQADRTLLMMWDSAAASLRASVVLSREGTDVVADRSAIERAFIEKRPLLLQRRGEDLAHPALGRLAAAEQARGDRTVMAAPLTVEDHALGVLCLERGADRPLNLADLRHGQAVARLLGVFLDARQRAEALERRLEFIASDAQMVGKSPALRKVMDLAARVAPTKTSVLITGETGTGKEVLAREIHRLSAVKDGPFIAVNCSAVPETLFESLLFGHEAGAFTGALRTHQGYVEQANGGTLFLDEIGELSLALQPKLLRFLQERVFQRVGGQRSLRGDVRLVCATNRELEGEVATGRFREDLFHRISVLPLHLPALRDRKGDIALLAQHFISRYAKDLGKTVNALSAEAVGLLENYPWPGNVRELGNCCERAVILCDGPVLLAQHFQFAPASAMPRLPRGAAETRVPGFNMPSRAEARPEERLVPLSDVEREHIAFVLRHCGGNQVQAAEILGIHRNTLRKKILEYALR